MARAAPAQEVCWASAVPTATSKAVRAGPCLETAAGSGVEAPQPTLHGRLTQEPEAV